MSSKEVLAGDARMKKLALDLLALGVSKRGIEDLLVGYPLHEIERQIDYLPYRKARRPEAFVIEAVRNNYSPPKEYYYAKAQTEPSPLASPLDQGSQLPDPEPPADPD